MVKELILICFVLLNNLVYSQIEFSTVKHDFGDLEPYSARYFDLKLTNIGDKQEWLLSVKKPVDVTYIVSKQIIEKDSSILIRLHVTPDKKGRFSYSSLRSLTSQVLASRSVSPFKRFFPASIKSLLQR